jgi:BMFP domain-containing protein YqiC
MPTLQDIADLQTRVADLEAQLAQASPAAKPAPSAKAAAKTPARKSSRKA